jgi:hypothetical protein
MFIIALGIGLGIAIGAMRLASSPCEKIPSAETESGGKADPSPDTKNGPIAAIDQLNYNFGTLDIEKSGKHEFTISNRGNEVLKLTKGETTCRCAAGDLEKPEIAPGESAKIRLSWHPTAEVGAYEQSASFYTNDPKKKKIKITITGKITASLRILPASLTLARLSANETAHGSLAVLSYLDEPLEIKSYRLEEDAGSKFFDLAVSPLSETDLKEYKEAKSGYRLTVTVKPGLPQGEFRQRIVLETNNSDKPERSVSVEGSIGSEISVAGSNWDSERELLFLGNVKSETGVRQRLLLIVHGPYRKETHFSLAENPPSPLKVEIGEMSEINDGKVAQTPLIIEIPKGSPRASFLGKAKEGEEDAVDDGAAVIQITTTHPEISKIRLPVRFAVEQ